ncbi:MAG TPA: efflux RND transporter periplasmic adaptor subunit [Candidatus Binatia bacterium]|jgi:RND family efflux transporter MFP subunit
MLQRGNLSRFASLALLPFASAACTNANSSDDPRTQSALVRVATVEAATQTERSFTGIVAARVQSDLGFRVPGKILERLVDTGQTVTRGQPLMRIDAADLKLAARAREEAVAAAAARARQTEKDEIRDRALSAAGAVSASTYEKAEAAAKSAKAELNAADAYADVARNETSYTDLLADADGVVVETLAEPGQVVAAGQVVVRIAHAGQREAVIDLPETVRPAIGSMGRAMLYGSELTGSAQLRQLSDAANAKTRTFEARYVLGASLAEAPLGSTVSIQIPSITSTPTLRVPTGAIFDAGNGPGVWRIEGETPRVTWRAVEVSQLGAEAAAVVGDLAPGDRIVALGVHLLHEGESVRLAGSATAEP